MTRYHTTAGGNVPFTPDEEAEADTREAAAAATVADSALKSIDADVDAIYAAVIGYRAAEYERAEREALDYAAANYAGAAPAMVAAWATAKGWPGQQAADNIIAQATVWRDAQLAIRAARLAHKEQVRAAGTPADIAAVLAAWQAFVGATRAALGA